MNVGFINVLVTLPNRRSSCTDSFNTVPKAFAMSASAHDNGFAHQHQQNNNTGNQVIGALIGGVAGAALGDGIAGRGQSTEFGIAGGLLGGPNKEAILRADIISNPSRIVISNLYPMDINDL